MAEDFWTRYNEYLKSDWWKQTREKTIKRYGGKCFCCNKESDLQVHHLSYDHLGFEKENELICLCSGCHSWIEDQKEQKVHLSLDEQMRLLEEHKLSFRKDNEPVTLSKWTASDMFIKAMVKDKRDRSSHGSANLTDLEVIRQEFDIWCRNNRIKCEGGKPSFMTIQEYFRNRRYEIILKFVEGNYPQSLCYNRTLFSRRMIANVYKNPDNARWLLSKEKKGG